MAKREPITAARLREVLIAYPETGEFEWVDPAKAHKGKPGNLFKQGADGFRVRIGIDYKRYLAHHLMWLWVHGEWPDEEIDHWDNDPTNNRISNLRPATRAENRRNARRRRDNTSGLVGASFDKRRNKWLVVFRGKNLGRYDTAEEAHAVYRKAALEVYGDFAHSSLKKI